MSVPPLRESEAVFYLVPKFYFSLLSFPNRIWERENEAVCAFAEYASSVDYSQEAGACIQRFWKE